MRFLYKDASVNDLTVNLKKYKSGSESVTLTTTQAIYIGQRVPFNHLYFKMSTLNLNAANLTLTIWDGSAWEPLAEVIDETNAFQQNGFITWTPDKDETGWMMEDTDDIADLNTVKIYDLYWLKITTDTTLSQVDFDWVGQKFSTDDDLYSVYPIFSDSNMKTAHTSGKVDWEEQHVAAAEVIADDLKASGVIFAKGQILNRDVFKRASMHKVAELAYTPFGDDYRQRMLDARAEYKDAMDRSIFEVDRNNDARLEPYEKKQRMGWATR